MALPPGSKVSELFTLYLLTSTPCIPAIIALLRSPSAGSPQRLFPSISISKEEPAVNSQSGFTIKISLKFRLFTLLSEILPGRLPPGKIEVRS